MIDRAAVACAALSAAGRPTILHGLSESPGGEDFQTVIDPRDPVFGSAGPRT